MKNLALALVLAVAPLSGFAQAPADPAPKPTLVSVTAKGAQVNGVLVDLFAQAKRQVVIEPNLTFALFLSLRDIEFEKALAIVCDQVGLEYEVKDGITYVRRRSAKPEPKKPAPKPAAAPTVLDRIVSVRMTKANIRTVFFELSRVSKTPIAVEESVPDLTLDAIMQKTTLRYALEKIASATGLRFELLDGGRVRVFTPKADSASRG